jgi:hypothetical protein
VTVMAAEAGAGAAEAGASEASAGASQAVRSAPGVRQAAGRASRAPAAPRARPRAQPAPAGPSRQGGSRRRGDGQRRDLGQRIRRTNVDLSSNRTNYQNVVLAEFIAAVLLVAATPFAKKDSPGVSPYEGKDLLQLVFLTVVYFILALISGGGRGAARFAAWFGFLILLTVGLAEAARLATLFNVFGLEPKPTPAAGGPPPQAV